MQAPVIPADWPNRNASRHVFCAPHLWHVQEIGSGPTLLMIHGAGGASHSWRGLVPVLADHYHLVIVDLPGQGFTRLGARHRCGLDAMAEDLARLIRQEALAPMAYIGHSAGAAIALRLAELAPPRAVIGLNAALGQFEGVAGWLFPIMATSPPCCWHLLRQRMLLKTQTPAPQLATLLFASLGSGSLDFRGRRSFCARPNPHHLLGR
jgi:magnesium chelatase accessory protein